MSGGSAAGDQPTAGVPTVNQPTLHQPTVGDPTVGQPTVVQPALDQPTIGQPAVPPVAPPGPGPRRGAGWILLVAGAVAVLVAGTALLLVVTGRDGGDTAAGELAPSSTAAGAAPTSQTTVVSPSTTRLQVPTNRAPIAAPTTVDLSPTSGADASAAVDRYLAASTSRDEATFASVWIYPIQDRYGEKGESEAQLRAAARAYWDRYPSMTFSRVGATTVTRAAGGWDTSTPYSFVGVKQNGDRTCGTTVLHLGFTDGWLVRTASEGTPDRTC